MKFQVRSLSTASDRFGGHGVVRAIAFPEVDLAYGSVDSTYVQSVGFGSRFQVASF